MATGEMDDPSALYTGSGSYMFANEKTRSDKVSAAKEQQSRQRSELRPIAKDLLEFLAKAKAENDSTTSYLQNIYAKRGHPSVSSKDLEVEFRARELNLALIARMELWIKSRTNRP